MHRPDQDELESWQDHGHFRRCRIVASARHEIAAAYSEIAVLCQSAQRPDPVDTISSELIPLCAALKFIGRRGPWILRTKRFGMLGRPVWLWGVRSKVQRIARGEVLVLAAWNYPLLLPGVQLAHALASGNRVYVKPAPGCEGVTKRLVELFWQAGIPRSVLRLLPSAAEAAIKLIDQGVNLVVLTGSSNTGRAVLRQCAEKLTPTILELSGCDAVIVGPDADLEHAAKSIRFGLMLNSGAACIAPRRIVVAKQLKSQLVELLRIECGPAKSVTLHPAAVTSVHNAVAETLSRGATNLLDAPPHSPSADPATFHPIIFDNVDPKWPIANCDLFAPIASLLTFDSDAEAIDIVNQCRYRLAAAIFGSRRWSNRIANQLDVGTITINDVIFPTADPRLPFGGCGESGFGVTRGGQGLLDMSLPRVIATHRGSLFLHLWPRKPSDLNTLSSLLTLTHARIGQKWATLRRLLGRVK